MLINKEDLLKKFDTGALLFESDIRKIIEEEPEAVVRCKDCVNYKEIVMCKECQVCSDPFESESCGKCKLHGRFLVSKAYCSYGERRTDE